MHELLQGGMMLLCWAMPGWRWQFRPACRSPATAPRQRQVAPPPLVLLQMLRCPNLHSADLHYPGPAIVWHRPCTTATRRSTNRPRSSTSSPRSKAPTTGAPRTIRIAP